MKIRDRLYFFAEIACKIASNGEHQNVRAK